MSYDAEELTKAGLEEKATIHKHRHSFVAHLFDSGTIFATYDSNR